jgi:hypothetical protein
MRPNQAPVALVISPTAEPLVRSVWTSPSYFRFGAESVGEAFSTAGQTVFGRKPSKRSSDRCSINSTPAMCSW